MANHKEAETESGLFSDAVYPGLCMNSGGRPPQKQAPSRVLMRSLTELQRDSYPPASFIVLYIL